MRCISTAEEVLKKIILEKLFNTGGNRRILNIDIKQHLSLSLVVNCSLVLLHPLREHPNFEQTFYPTPCKGAATLTKPTFVG